MWLFGVKTFPQPSNQLSSIFWKKTWLMRSFSGPGIQETGWCNYRWPEAVCVSARCWNWYLMIVLTGNWSKMIPRASRKEAEVAFLPQKVSDRVKEYIMKMGSNQEPRFSQKSVPSRRSLSRKPVTWSAFTWNPWFTYTSATYTSRPGICLFF